MRHFHTASPSRLANVALHDPDGYVETLLELARVQGIARRRQAIILGGLKPLRPNQRQRYERAPSNLQ
jgi:hypothetical protein